MFFVVITQGMTEGNVACAVYKYDTLDAAKQKYHLELSASIGATALDYAMCAILDASGNNVMHESWNRPAPLPTVE